MSISPDDPQPSRVEILELDRSAARALREALADLSGFWFRTDENDPLSQALAHHRVETERRLVAKYAPSKLAESFVPGEKAMAQIIGPAHH